MLEIRSGGFSARVARNLSARLQASPPAVPFRSMPPKVIKRILFLTAFFIIAALAAFWFCCGEERKLTVDFLDVGQGDAILIKSPYGQNVLIDGGPDKTILNRLAEKLDFADKKIDLMILTHPHDDHVAGLSDVVKQYDVKKIIYTGATHTGPNYLNWLELIRERKISLTIIDRPQTIKLGENCELEILYPLKSLAGQSADNLNNTSIVIKLIYGQTKFLLAGDMESDVERELSASGADLSADVLKVGHHGSDTSTGDDFLKAVGPKFAVIEVGKDNSFGHPSLRVLKRLERAGAKIFRTDQDGSIGFISDGATVSVQ